MTAVGLVTRGTTGPRRLRRFDRWLIAKHPQLLRHPDLLVVDVGFGEVPVTTVELFRRLRQVNQRVGVVGLDVDIARVDAARAHLCEGLTFELGGFELASHRPHVVRAFNVLRQYAESDVAGAWALMCSRLARGGIAVDGTCAEDGGLGAWVTLTGDGPRSLTLACDLAGAPAAVATRLPKALIHHNVAGERIHALLADLQHEWDRQSPLRAFGARQRFAAAVGGLVTRGWPVLDTASRWRRGELTVSWSSVAPAGLVPRGAEPGDVGSSSLR